MLGVSALLLCVVKHHDDTVTFGTEDNLQYDIALEKRKL